MVAAQLDREPQPLVCEGRRHPDIDHGNVGQHAADGVAERLRVPDGVGDVKAPARKQLYESVPQYGRVLGDGDPDGVGHLRPQREVDGDYGGATEGARHVEAAVDIPDPFSQPRQPARARARSDHRAAAPVVAHDEAQPRPGL